MSTARLIFTCNGRIDGIEGNIVEVTLFQNDKNTVTMEFHVDDFPSEIAVNNWFQLKQYRYKIGNVIGYKPVIELFPV